MKEAPAILFFGGLALMILGCYGFIEKDTIYALPRLPTISLVVGAIVAIAGNAVGKANDANKKIGGDNDQN